MERWRANRTHKIMQQIFSIDGMTCNGCRTHVEQQLNKLPGVEQAVVTLEDHTAKVTSQHPLTPDQIAASLPEKYSVKVKITTPPVTAPGMNKSVSEWRQLFPLFLIFGYLTTAAILMNINPWSGGDFMLDFMGLFYIVFGFFKLLDLKGFPASFGMYDPIAKRVPFYGWIYPFLETTLGLMFLLRWQVPVALIFTIIILGITTIGVVKTLLDKEQIQCACLGTALKLPMTKATLIENSVMLVMAVWMLSR